MASTASSSNAVQSARSASWSNASHAWEDFKDSFDRFTDVDTVSSDIELFSSDSRRVHMYGLTSDGQQYYTAGTLGTALALPILSSGHYKRVWIDLHKEWLPAAGTYKFYWAFTDVLQNIRSSGVDNVVGDYSVVADVQKNVDPGSSSGNVSVYKSQNLWSSWINIKTSSKTGTIGYYMDLYDSANIQQVKLVLRQFGADFKTDSNSVTVDAPSSNNQSSTDIVSDALENLGSNSDRQVEQGDSIIELIKNTIQTISSQLESFWNQLAGEFTNLYNKMNQQHAEKMQSDEDTRETISSEAEKSRNFIVDGIINGLKSLFIPSDDYFKAWFDDMYAFFNDRFGFLMFPVDLLVKMVNLYLGADSSFSGVPFPEFKWVDGTVIIPAQSVQFTFLETDWGKDIQTKLYFVGNIIMIGALLSLMHRKFEEVLRN